MKIEIKKLEDIDVLMAMGGFYSVYDTDDYLDAIELYHIFVQIAIKQGFDKNEAIEYAQEVFLSKFKKD